MSVEALEAELRARFDVRTERFVHGATELEVLLPRSAEELIDVSDFNRDERLPYWAELWPSARALARELLDAERLPGSALELGCGIGLPSTVLARRGGRALATDYYGDALLFARLNAARNGADGLEVREVDWRDPPFDLPRAPLLLAADVLYEARNVEPLVAAMARLTQPGGEVWLADPGRVYFGPFLERSAAAGWSVAADRLRLEVNPADAARPIQIRIVRLRRRPRDQRPPPR